MRHLRVKRTNVAHRLPRGKRAPETEINYFQTQQSNTQIFIHEKKILVNNSTI
ncbi:hypothetical protein IHV10_08420 [Fictibacillus sp. 5RED26]|uniref:hypothetical protein n=1 Tax=Fictibacillus sp. 5RED26 TaxID=2745876 RepID=UPI0018CD3348|nr:hypothetical protein [Fictibacillus sp. 5RED26]MBH0156386.1 hypothetical protein [Fictibacillus sp. 5RED26]